MRGIQQSSLALQCIQRFFLDGLALCFDEGWLIWGQ
jgi:hypothetical protein